MGVQQQVNSILLSILDVKEADITPDAQIIGKLGATSVDVVEIVAALENEFDIDISDEDAQKLRTPGDIVKYVEAKTA